ncbi:MAG: hypothetical protein IJ186_01985 [Bacilli bacterium]|nr:hypothetical protein [Bacilli bacterium]
MANLARLNKHDFELVVKSSNVSFDNDFDFLYEVYNAVIDGIYEVMEAFQRKYNPVNHYIVIMYILNEYLFEIGMTNKEDVARVKESDDFFNLLSSICADKYLTNEQLNYRSQSFINKFNPPVSTLDLYLNFILQFLGNNATRDRYNNLVRDMLVKAFQMSKCILSLIIDGFETEGYSTWRTLHENECILITLINNGKECFDEYFKHIRYAFAYRGEIPSKEETDKVFADIKNEMKEHGLKSKDMKKFIEYGYLYKVKNLDQLENFKLNFRDGVENAAGLKEYSKTYEYASEIAHSSPLLLYSKKTYYFGQTIINLYESFFRLERIFSMYYKSTVPDELFRKYEDLKKLYLTQLHSIYRIYKRNFPAKVEQKFEREEN